MSQYKKALWTIAVKGLVKAEEKQLLLHKGESPEWGSGGGWNRGGGGAKTKAKQ